MNCRQHSKTDTDILPAKAGYVRLGMLAVGAEFRLKPTERYPEGRQGTVHERGRDVETICEGQPSEVIVFSPALEVVALGSVSPNYQRGRRS